MTLQDLHVSLRLHPYRQTGVLRKVHFRNSPDTSPAFKCESKNWSSTSGVPVTRYLSKTLPHLFVLNVDRVKDHESYRHIAYKEFCF